MQEKWVQWKPFNGLVKTYYIELIKESCDGFEIILADSNIELKKSKIRMEFNCRVTSYRNTDEVARLTLLELLSQRYGTDFYAEWKLFKVENSKYLEWLSKESGGYTDSLKLKHYVVMDDDSLLDIASACDPVFELME